MGFFFRFIARSALNGAAIFIADRYLSGFEIIPQTFPIFKALAFSPLEQTLIVGAVILAVLNTFLRPVLKFISFPVILLTFGLFNIVINMAILFLADRFFDGLAISTFSAFFFSSILIGLVNSIL